MDIAKSIIQGLSEAVEYEKGNKSKAKKRSVEIAESSKVGDAGDNTSDSCNSGLSSRTDNNQ